MSTFPRGSEWRKWDFHIHTPGTAKNDNYTGHEDIWKAYIAKLESFTDIAVLGITDYLSIENYIKVKDIQSTGGLQGKLLVPNVELRILPHNGGHQRMGKRVSSLSAVSYQHGQRFSFAGRAGDYKVSQGLCEHII